MRHSISLAGFCKAEGTLFYARGQLKARGLFPGRHVPFPPSSFLLPPIPFFPPIDLTSHSTTLSDIMSTRKRKQDEPLEALPSDESEEEEEE